jgi:hypothetical protein
MSKAQIEGHAGAEDGRDQENDRKGSALDRCAQMESQKLRGLDTILDWIYCLQLVETWQYSV